jgi:hypothetical protein
LPFALQNAQQIAMDRRDPAAKRTIGTMAQSYTNTALLLDDTTDFGAVENLTKKVIRDGEEALLLAMLEMATEDFQKYILATDPQGKALFREAEEWILASDNRWFFSFENICRHLNFSPSYIRRGLMRWKEAKLRAHAEQCAENLEQPDGNESVGTVTDSDKSS